MTLREVLYVCNIFARFLFSVVVQCTVLLLRLVYMLVHVCKQFYVSVFIAWLLHCIMLHMCLDFSGHSVYNRAMRNTAMFRVEKNAYSSHCKSRVSLTRSRKQPSECMLSNTSGSSSVRDKIRLTHTRLGGGCSGHGSLRPPLGATHTRHTMKHTHGWHRYNACE